MSEESDTAELRAEQLARERKEQEQAHTAPPRARRRSTIGVAEKAQYLRQKLDERAESERQAARREDDS